MAKRRNRWKFHIEISNIRNKKDMAALNDFLLTMLEDYRDSGDAPLDWYVSKDMEETFGVDVLNTDEA